MFLCNILCVISDSTKTIRLLALDFYEVIVDSGFALINYHLIEISSLNVIKGLADTVPARGGGERAPI